MACPHRNIIYCPLYHAAHDAAISDLSCLHTGEFQWECLTDHGQSYLKMVEKVRAVAPRLVAQCKWNEDAEEHKQQRLRNLRAAGIQ